MKIFSKVIAATRKESASRQYLHFLEHKGIEWEFRGPTALKHVRNKWKWYMLKCCDIMDEEKVSSMITKGENLSDRLKWS